MAVHKFKHKVNQHIADTNLNEVLYKLIIIYNVHQVIYHLLYNHVYLKSQTSVGNVGYSYIGFISHNIS